MCAHLDVLLSRIPKEAEVLSREGSCKIASVEVIVAQFEGLRLLIPKVLDFLSNDALQRHDFLF